MRLPSLVLGLSAVLVPGLAHAEPTRSFPLPEASAPAPQPGEHAYVPPAAPSAPAPRAAPAAPEYYSSQSYPQGYTQQPPPARAGYAWSGYYQSPGPATDRPADEPRKDDERGPSSVTVSLSLLHLIGPLAEGTLELRPFDHVGIAGVLGRGNFKVDGDDYSVWEYGGQLNIYSSAFDGLAVTGEVFRFSGEGEPEPGVKGSGRGTLLSGLIGYKGITSGGFTLVIQGGFTRVLAEVSAEKADLGSASEDASTWLPMANLNLGFTL
ncbi:MAG: hypothetical protein KC766_03210 [Myxococcales bacterium]|nr:hypothetical protein [Myxococcales bacterium]